MTRGYFDFIKRESAYVDSDKDWHVELIQSTCIWYDLILHPPESHNTKQQIKNFLKQLESDVESQLDKRFIYFLGARKKLRFCLSKKPKYSIFGSDLIFYVEIGRERIIKKFITKIFDHETRKPIKPLVEICERFITFYIAPNCKESIPIHEFMAQTGLESGIDTEIHYVGYTRNPSRRPINGEHRGFSHMLYRVPSDDNDFFVFYNLFKVISIAKNKSTLLNFCVANSVIDEIGANEEGNIIEKTLIKYFGAEVQEENKFSEASELENSLERLAARNKINSVSIYLEMEQPNELHRFFSRNVRPSHKHAFTCHMKDGCAEIVEAAPLSDVLHRG